MNITRFRKVALCACFSVGFLLPSHAVVLLTYNFTGGSAAPTLPAAGLTAGNVSFNGVTGGFSSSTNTAFILSANSPTAFLGTAYLSFTVTADAGKALDLSSFSFNLGGDNSSATIAYTVGANVRSNAEMTPYSTDLAMTPGPVTTATRTISPGQSLAFTTYTVDLGASSYDNLGSITFRIYPFDNQNSANFTYRLDNFSLDGTVHAVPEPATWSLLFAGGMVLLRLRRNKQPSST